MDNSSFYRRNLPHIQPSHARFFVTFRLAGSLPKEVIIRLKCEQEIIEKNIAAIENEVERASKREEEGKRYFGKFDDYLDKVSNDSLWLQNESVAKLVTDALHYRDGKEYELHAYCVMPNHVHAVFSITEEHTVARLAKSRLDPSRLGKSCYILTDVLFSLKRYTAYEANKILKRSGAFWQHESYDHVVRNDKEFYRIIHYVLNNPVKAGFVDRWEEWKWSYVKL